MSTNGGRAWTAIYGLLQSQKPWMSQRLAQFELTPILAHALDVLAGDDGKTMREFADGLYADASNATGIVDRLERRGLVRRETSADDRRAKIVRLTGEGTRMQKRTKKMVWETPPPPVAALSSADQRVLREILERALANVKREREI